MQAAVVILKTVKATTVMSINNFQFYDECI